LGAGGPVGDLAFAGGRLWRLEFAGGQTYEPLPPVILRSYDVTDPAAPRQASRAVLPLASAFTYDPLRLVLDGDLAYVLFTEKTSSTDRQRWLAIVDLADPDQPDVVARMALSEPYGDLLVRWGHAFVADAAGILVVDVRRPASPVLLGRLVGEPALGADSLWLDRGLLTVAGGASGILVYRPDLDWPPEAGVPTATPTSAPPSPTTFPSPWPTLTPPPPPASATPPRPPSPVRLPLLLRNK
jgi:hypothetical protein